MRFFGKRPFDTGFFFSLPIEGSGAFFWKKTLTQLFLGAKKLWVDMRRHVKSPPTFPFLIALTIDVLHSEAHLECSSKLIGFTGQRNANLTVPLFELR